MAYRPDDRVIICGVNIVLESFFQNALSENQFLLASLLSMLAGFLTSLSPCVYPLIPITLGILGTRQYQSYRQGFFISLVYVLGMIFLYCVLGVVFVSLGLLAGSALQSTWVTGLIGLFFILLSLSMFNAFEFALPAAVVRYASQIKNRSYFSIFLMGLVSGLIAAPCTGPVLTFILTLVAKEGDFIKGSVFMLLYSVGLGIPFLVLGTFSSFVARIPKSGPWMHRVKSVLGIAMLSVALYYLQFSLKLLYHLFVFLNTLGVPVLICFILIGCMIGAIHFSFRDKINGAFFNRALGVLLIAISCNALAVSPDVKDNSWIVLNKEDQVLTIFQEKLQIAKKQKKPVIIDFSADWCSSCKELEKYTYTQNEVKRALSRFMLIKIDVTHETKELNMLQKQFNVVGLPTILFVDSKGNLQSEPRLFGFVKEENFLKYLKLVK